jgi:hypothetical protein
LTAAAPEAQDVVKKKPQDRRGHEKYKKCGLTPMFLKKKCCQMV